MIPKHQQLARSQTDLDLTVQQIPAESGRNGQRVIAVAVDLANAAAIGRAIDDIRPDLGRVDILVNAAGIDVPGSIDELAPRLRACRKTQPWRRALSSILAPWPAAGGWANAAAYCSSKFALTGLTQSLAAEGKASRIRAILLYPGAMNTEWGAWTPEERNQRAPDESLAPIHVAGLITWIVQSPL